MPGVNSADAATHAANDLIEALNNLALASPFSIYDEKVAALKKLAEIFDTATGRNSTGSKEVTAPHLRVTTKTTAAPI
jgi:hypothetical protein